jgi:hypothetical protein
MRSVNDHSDDGRGDDVDEILLRTLCDRIQERIRVLDTNKAKVNAAAKLGESAVNDILGGRNTNPNLFLMHRIAVVLECDLEYLLGTSDIVKATAPIEGATPVPIAGEVEDGAWRKKIDLSSQAMAQKESQKEIIYAVTNRHYPTARRFAVTVKGDGMDATKPHPILPGAKVICVDFEEAELEVENGKLYVLQLRRPNNTFEYIIRRAKTSRKAVEFLPESSNPVHQPMTLPRDFNSDPTQDVRVIGLVYNVSYSFEG